MAHIPGVPHDIELGLASDPHSKRATSNSAITSTSPKNAPPSSPQNPPNTAQQSPSIGQRSGVYSISKAESIQSVSTQPSISIPNRLGDQASPNTLLHANELHSKGLNIPNPSPSPKEIQPIDESPPDGPDLGSGGSPIDGNRRAFSQTLEQKPALYEEYNKMADKEDREFVKAANENLNTLLIFAGIFAAINASFIMETLKGLKADPQETANDLLRRLIDLHAPNNTRLARETSAFNPTPRDIRTNLAFFSSLSTSLAGSFLAVMGKQWLTHYEHEGSLKPPPERARERHRKFQGRESHHLQGVVESLPTLLQASLFIFLAGLADLLWPLNVLVSTCVIIFTLAILSAWAILTAVATLRPSFPYQTRLSVTLRHFMLRSHRIESTADQNLAIDIHIIAQMLKNTVMSDAVKLDMLADCIGAIRSQENVRHLGDVAIKFLVDPLYITTKDKVGEQKLTLGEGFRSPGMLRVVRALLRFPSAFESAARNAIMSHVFHVGSQSQMESSVVDTVVDIAMDAVETGSLPGVNTPNSGSTLGLDPIHRSNMAAVVVLQMHARLAKGSRDENAMASCWACIIRCLPNTYRQDSTFSKVVHQLSEIIEALPPNDPHIISVATAITAHLQLLAPPPSPERGNASLLRGLTIHKGFWSLPMLKIVRAMFRGPSTLQANVREAFLHQICIHDWEEWMELEASEILADLMMLHVEAGGVRQWPSWVASVHESVMLPVVQHLYRRLTRRRSNYQALFNLLYQCLPQDYSSTPEFMSVHRELIELYERFSVDHRYIRYLATLVDDIFQASPAGPTHHIPETFWSAFMLKLIYLLFRSPFILSSDSRQIIISYLWPRFWTCAPGPEIEVMGDIVAMGAMEVLRMDNWSYPSEETLADIANKHSTFVAHLCCVIAGNAREAPHEESKIHSSCSLLLHHYLGPQYSDRPGVISGVLKSLFQLSHPNKGDAFIVCLRALLASSMVESPDGHRLGLLLASIQEDHHLLWWLRSLLEESYSNLASGGLGLAISMAFWAFNPKSNLFATEGLSPGGIIGGEGGKGEETGEEEEEEEEKEEEEEDPFEAIILSLLNRLPHPLGERSLLGVRGDVPCTQLTWEEAFSMLERVSAYLGTAPGGLKYTKWVKIREDYSRWCEWLCESPNCIPMYSSAGAVRNLGYQVEQYAPPYLLLGRFPELDADSTSPTIPGEMEGAANQRLVQQPLSPLAPYPVSEESQSTPNQSLTRPITPHGFSPPSKGRSCVWDNQPLVSITVSVGKRIQKYVEYPGEFGRYPLLIRSPSTRSLSTTSLSSTSQYRRSSKAWQAQNTSFSHPFSAVPEKYIPPFFPLLYLDSLARGSLAPSSPTHLGRPAEETEFKLGTSSPLPLVAGGEDSPARWSFSGSLKARSAGTSPLSAFANVGPHVPTNPAIAPNQVDIHHVPTNLGEPVQPSPSSSSESIEYTEKGTPSASNLVSIDNEILDPSFSDENPESPDLTGFGVAGTDRLPSGDCGDSDHLPLPNATGGRIGSPLDASQDSAPPLLLNSPPEADESEHSEKDGSLSTSSDGVLPLSTNLPNLSTEAVDLFPSTEIAQIQDGSHVALEDAVAFGAPNSAVVSECSLLSGEGNPHTHN